MCVQVAALCARNHRSLYGFGWTEQPGHDMRIGIDARPLSKQRTGIEDYAA